VAFVLDVTVLYPPLWQGDPALRQVVQRWVTTMCARIAQIRAE